MMAVDEGTSTMSKNTLLSQRGFRPSAYGGSRDKVKPKTIDSVGKHLQTNIYPLNAPASRPKAAETTRNKRRPKPNKDLHQLKGQ